MTAKVEVKLCWVGDAHIYGSAGWNVAAAAYLILPVGTEEARVVALLYHDEGDAWLVVRLQLHARLPHRTQLMGQHLHTKHTIKSHTPFSTGPKGGRGDIDRP